ELSAPMLRFMLQACAAATLTAAVACAPARAASSRFNAAGAPVVVNVGSAAGRPIPPGFVGVSFEYDTVPKYTGTVANPVLAQLIRGLQHGHATTLRIGGDSTDWSWWPVPGVTPPW